MAGKVEKVMGEFKRGELHHGGSGKVVAKGRPDIAIAIALRSAREAGEKVTPYRKDIRKRAAKLIRGGR